MQALVVYGRPVPPAAVDYLLQPQLPSLDSTPVLNRLVNMRFVTKEAGRYSMHPADREYALQRLSPELAVSSGQSTVASEQSSATNFLSLISNLQSSIFKPQSPISDLQSRAADYFRATRSPRATWKTLADLAPQLAEIDMRCAAGDYEAAARVLGVIDFDYLLLWGHYWLVIDQHERLRGKLNDTILNQCSTGNLGTAYYKIGRISRAIPCYEQAVGLTQEAKDYRGEGVWINWLGNCYSDLGLMQQALAYYEKSLAIAREIGDKDSEGCILSNLGNRYADLGQTHRAIELYEEAMAIDRETGDKYGEGIDLENLAHVLIDEGHYPEAIQHALTSAKIGEEISNPQVGSESYYILALVHLYSGNLSAARATAEQARQYDDPRNNHNVLALLGVIARRQNDPPAAREAFTAALAHAESLLAHTPEYLDVLDARALALAGLGRIEEARAAYQAARAINSDAGIVGRATRLLEQIEGVPRFWEA